MNLLSTEQQKSLDAASEDVPARIVDPESKAVLVLLPSDDFDWIRNLLGDESDAPRAADPRTKREYAMIPEVRYNRFMPFFEEDPISPQEREWALREFGRRAGWDDPEWDNWDEITGREAS
jgi:hypothetical protein